MNQNNKNQEIKPSITPPMAKEFAVPPVFFPSATASVPFQRRPSSPPNFNPAPLPFMSFDVPSTSNSQPPLFSGHIASPYGSFEDETPLLEELGINTRQIWKKTICILNPFKGNMALFEEGDLSGPFLFLMAFGLFQLLAGRFYFGIILGWVIIASLFLYFTFNMIAGKNGRLDLYRCHSLVGYCMIPMVIFSAVSIFLPRGGKVIFSTGMVFVIWSSRVCTKLMVQLDLTGDEHRALVGYACWLVYMLFSLLVIF